MLQKRFMLVVGSLVVLSMILAACGQATPTTQAPAATTASSGGTQATLADTIVVGTWQEPESFLQYANSAAIRVEIQEVFRPPFVFTKSGAFQPNPVLVDGDLPSYDNGGAVLNDVTVKAGEPIFNPDTQLVEAASADTTAKQLVVTGKIQAGLVWDDGQPLTAQDFVFAWKTNCSADSGAVDVTFCPLGSVDGAGGVLQNYEATDDTTLVATYVPGSLDPTYFLTPYGPYGLLPVHLFEGMSPADILVDERASGSENAVPLGWGAYSMVQWKKGDSITFAPNPHWEGTAPLTPNIIYKFYSDSVALASAVIAGEVDTSSGITGVDVGNAPYLAAADKAGLIHFSADTKAASFEMMYMNYNDPNDPAFKTADLAGEKPHPVLSDYNVRKAIAMSLNRQKMVDTIFFGYSAVVEQPQLPQMISYDPSVGTITYDVAAANKILDDAGWVMGSDGVRVKDGVRASIGLLTTSGNALRQKSTQIIQASLKDIGIEVKITYQPASVVFSADGLYGRNWDMIEFANVFSVIDPGSWWFGIANCAQILTGANGFAGNNFAGWCRQDVSSAVADAAYLTADPATRKADWDLALQAYFAAPTGDDYRTGGYPLIPLFVRPNFLATSIALQGPVLDSTEYFTWNVETWTLSQ